MMILNLDVFSVRQMRLAYTAIYGWSQASNPQTSDHEPALCQQGYRAHILYLILKKLLYSKDFKSIFTNTFVLNFCHRILSVTQTNVCILVFYIMTNRWLTPIILRWSYLSACYNPRFSRLTVSKSRYMSCSPKIWRPNLRLKSYVLIHTSKSQPRWNK